MITIQNDGKTKRIKVSKLLNMLADNASNTKIIDFEEEE